MAKENQKTSDQIQDNLQELYDLNYLRNKARELLQDYINDPSNEIEDLTSASNIKFNGVLMFLRRELLGDGLLIYDKQRKDYNILLAYNFCRLYVELCNKYDKVVSVLGFGYLTSIEDSTITSWRNNKVDNNLNIHTLESSLFNIYNIPFKSISTLFDNNSNSLGALSYGEILTTCKKWIAQTLHKSRENGLKDRLLTSKMPLGQISVGNQDYNWSSENKAREEKAKALALSELPILADYVNKAKALEEHETQENP